MSRSTQSGSSGPWPNRPPLWRSWRPRATRAPPSCAPLVIETARQEKLLRDLEDMVADGVLNRRAYTRQCKRLNDRIGPLEARIATLRAHSAAGQLGSDLHEAWPKMTPDEQRAVFMTLVTHIEVSPTNRKSGNKFDPGRVVFAWRSWALAQAVGLRDGDMVDPEQLAQLWATGVLPQVLGWDRDDSRLEVLDDAAPQRSSSKTES